MSIIKGTNQIVAGFGGTKRSIGEVYFSQSSLATDNSGALPLFTGETIASANTIYPDFYNWVSAHTELQCTSAEYESALSTYGECAKYVIGDGSLRLPNKALSHGTVIKEKKPTNTDPTWYRQWSDGWLEQGGTIDTVNKTITFLKPFADTNYTLIGPGFYIANAGSQSVTKTTAGFTTTSIANLTAAMYWEAKGQGADGAQEETLYPWVVAYTAAIPASVAQAAEFQQGLSGKADTNLGNITSLGKKSSVSWIMPDYSRIISTGLAGSPTSQSTNSYTCPTDGWILMQASKETSGYTLKFYVNGNIKLQFPAFSASYSNTMYPVGKGDVINLRTDATSSTWVVNWCDFIPCKGA